MPLNETELLERDAKRNIGEELLAAIREIKSGLHGANYAIEPNENVTTRVKCGLYQTQFAKALHISSRTLQQWEQGRRHPSGAAETLLNSSRSIQRCCVSFWCQTHNCMGCFLLLLDKHGGHREA